MSAKSSAAGPRASTGWRSGWRISWESRYGYFSPDYQRYGRRAPLVRNEQIVEYADQVLAFWDGESHGTGRTIALCIEKNRPVRVIPIPSEE